MEDHSVLLVVGVHHIDSSSNFLILVHEFIALKGHSFEMYSSNISEFVLNLCLVLQF